MNYGMFRQYNHAITSKSVHYPLRCLASGRPNNIGNYDNQYNYAFTSFCDFDRFLFSEWKQKPMIQLQHSRDL